MISPLRSGNLCSSTGPERPIGKASPAAKTPPGAFGVHLRSRSPQKLQPQTRNERHGALLMNEVLRLPGIPEQLLAADVSAVEGVVDLEVEAGSNIPKIPLPYWTQID